MKNPYLQYLLSQPSEIARLIYPLMLSNADNMKSVFVPHPVEQKVIENQARNKVIVAGRRWGKSLLASTLASACIMAGVMSKGSQPTRGWVVSKNYELASKVFRLIYRSLVIKSRFKPVSKKDIDSNAHIEFEGGSVVEAKSADSPDSLIGEGLDWIVFDEAAACKAVIWEQYLRPTLTDREGIAIFITTPRGYNWIYDLFKRGQSEDFPTWASWRSPSKDNPFLEESEIEQARLELSTIVFEQEYMASFQSNVGAVYSDFDIISHGISKLEIDPRWRHFRSIDFGYENPFVCLWIAVNPLDQAIIYDEYYKSRVSVEQAAAEIFQREQEHAQWIGTSDKMIDGKDAVEYEYTTCDPSAASARATLLEKGIATIAPRSEVLTGIELIRQQLKYREDGKTGLLVDLERCPNTIKEFQLYHYPEPTSRDSNENPVKENDHSMDSFRYWIVQWKRGIIRQSTARF
jgi:PBSX family phage terminase large subunit